MALPTLKQFTTRQPAYTTPVLTLEQQACLNRMIGEAAFDRTVEHRLLHQRDETLRNRYQLTPLTWSHIQAIKANTLEEFCAEVSKLKNMTINH